jgi:hypothetical protein
LSTTTGNTDQCSFCTVAVCLMKEQFGGF